MPDEKKFSELTTAATLTNDDILALSQMQSGALTSVKATLYAIAVHITKLAQYTSDLQTTDKTIIGAINELKQLISLIPQFSIEVVQALPTEDISDTTIYLVPAEDPETGNYYEEYIHVNDAWELVGTTSVDLSAYYTKLEVDGLLATKANAAEVTAALATKENKSDMPTDVRTIIKDCKTPKSATITNGIAQFDCIEENLVKGLKVTMNPIQDLHGYSNPWAGGAGKNKCPEFPYPYTAQNPFVEYSNEITFNGITLSLTFSGSFANIGAGFLIGYDENGTASYSNAIGALKKISDNTNIQANTTYTNERFYFSINLTIKIKKLVLTNYPSFATGTKFEKVQLESGTSVTDFAPYSNICPISGRTEASVTRTGKNQFTYDTTYYNGYWTGSMPNPVFNGNNEERTLDEATGWQYVKIPVSGISSIANSGLINQGGVNSCFLSSDNPTDIISIFLSVDNNGVKTIPSNAKYMCLCFYNAKVQSSSHPNAQIELGSTATSYEPYTAETHTKEFGQTVYGGSLDLNSGLLTIDREIVDLGTLNWTKYDVAEGTLFRTSLTDAKLTQDVNNVLCEDYFFVLKANRTNKTLSIPDNEHHIDIIDNSYSTAEAFKTAMSGHQLCYELATPATISTSAEEITTVEGTNIISGTEPISECKYTELATVDDLRKIIGGAE